MGTWLYGSLVSTVYQGQYILSLKDIYDTEEINFENVEVNPDTIGQFTGLHDKNGKEIYEGDIVSTALGKCEVIHTDYGWGFCTIDDKAQRSKEFYRTFEAWHVFIMQGFLEGNIHDNPELMKGGEE